jgi:hypothetical protein
MKKIFNLLVFITIFSNCKAQSTIIDLYGPERIGAVNNAYYKDINGFHNQYEGTWFYANGNTSLKLVFVKKNKITARLGGRLFYEDYLIGEYQYVENGIEKVNTLSNLNINYGNDYLDIINHNLVSSSCLWYPKIRPRCNECQPNERRLDITLSEPSIRHVRGLAHRFVLRAFTENGLQKLKVWFVNEAMSGLIFDQDGNLTNITTFSLPYGEYTLVKQ